MTNGVKFEKLYTEQELQGTLKPTFWHEFAEYLFYFLRVFIVVSLLFTFIRSFVFYTIGIEGDSMFPNLKDKELVYLDLFTPKFSSFERGDIVVIKPPQNIYEEDQKLYIKRVVGLPGESVGFLNDKVIIYNTNYPDGITLKEPYIDFQQVKTTKKGEPSSKLVEEDKLGDGEYYLLGDNRSVSKDSRVFGEVENSRIVGKVFYINRLTSKDGFFSLPKYNINN
jgi:signal peptidase I